MHPYFAALLIISGNVAVGWLCFVAGRRGFRL